MSQYNKNYTQFFPQGGGSRYSEYVFRTFDRDDNGMISFEVFKDCIHNIRASSCREVNCVSN